MYMTDLLKKDELGKLFMVSYNPTLLPKQGIVYNIHSGKAYNLTDLPEGCYENFEIRKNKSDGRVNYYVKDCTLYRPHEFQKYVCNIIANITVDEIDYYLINSLYGRLVWMDKEGLKLYINHIKSMYETMLGNFKFDFDNVVITKYKNNLDLESLEESLNGASKLYNKLITAIVSFKIRQYFRLRNLDIKLKFLDIENEESKFGAAGTLNNTYGFNIETVQNNCDIQIKVKDHIQPVSIYTRFGFDSKIKLEIQLFMVGLGKGDPDYRVGHYKYKYELCKKINNTLELKEAIKYINSIELYDSIAKNIIESTREEVLAYEQYKQQKNYIEQVVNERQVAERQATKQKVQKQQGNKIYQLEYVVKSSRSIAGYIVRNLTNNTGGYLDKEKIIKLAKDGLVKSVEVYKSDGNLKLRGTDGFKLSSLPRMVDIKHTALK